MIRVGLIDDNQEDLRILREYLNRYSQEEKEPLSIAEFQNGINFVEDYDGQLDVVFLDIEMPHMDGLEAAKRIRQKDSSLGIVFVTNMAQYAIRGYEVNAIDFVVKPVGYYVFIDKLKRAVEFAKKQEERYLVLEEEDRVIKIAIPKILYVEKDKNYLIYHTESEQYRVRGTLRALEDTLEREGFSKCINGCLVNLRYVTKVEKNMVWLSQISIPISRQRRKAFKNDFMWYIGGLV